MIDSIRFSSGGGFWYLLWTIFYFLFRFFDPLDLFPPWLEEILDQNFEIQTRGVFCISFYSLPAEMCVVVFLAWSLE